MQAQLLALLSVATLLFSTTVPAASASEVNYAAGRITIRCNNESLGQVFDQVKAATGVELLLDGSVRNTRLTADIVNEPVNVALERLLEGSGLNYVMLMDRVDWQRVAKMYIGSGGAGGGGASGSARSTPPPATRRPVREVEEEEPEPAIDESAPVEDFGNEAQRDDDDENPDPNQPPVGMPAQPPVPNYIPPPQVFPRSSFSPKNPFEAPATSPQPGGAYPYGANPYGGPPGSNMPAGSTPPPPANFPFVDAFGRPIPVPQQQQDQNKPKE